MRPLALVALAACWTSPAAPPPAAPKPAARVVARRVVSPVRSRCEATVDHVVDIEREELVRIPDFLDNLDAIREVAVASCVDTEWSEELTRCFSETVDTTAFSQCGSLFTSEQSEDLWRRVKDIIAGPNAPPPITP